MPSLSKITGLPDKTLQEKFKLVPYYRFDANEADNLVFMSPTVLLKDEELRYGGTAEIGATEFLSLLTKKILEEDSPKYFEVPEITATHMGYGRKSSNKESRKAIEESEAKFWMSKLTAVKKGKKVPGAEMPNPDLPDDGHAFEDPDDEDKENRYLIDKSQSGLEIKVKGSYLLFFSILLIFFGSKSKLGSGNIGQNKVSDFLIFWTLPFLLNFSSRKLRDIERHYQVHEDRVNFDTVEITAREVIEKASEGIKESADYVENMLDVYRDLLGSDAIEQRYKVFASQDGSPIIFVPLKYQETRSPVKLKYLGKRKTWSKLGLTTLTEDFLSKFVKSKEIQRDVFSSMKDVGKLQGVQYGIILPDAGTYKMVIQELSARSRDILTQFGSGRGIVDVPNCAVVEEKEGKKIISFSYLPDNPTSERVAALVYALGSQYIDHVTIVILHGMVLNNEDPVFKIGNIHPVEEVEQLVREDQQLVRSRRSSNYDEYVVNFSNTFPRFSETNFPQNFPKWEKEVREIKIVKNAKLEPKDKFQSPVNCLFHEKNCPASLQNNILPKIQHSEYPEDYDFRVFNPNGCAIKLLEKSFGSHRMSLLLALKNCAGLDTEPKRYSNIAQQIVKHFVKAIVTAGLPEVFPMTSQTNQEMPSGNGAGSDERSKESVNDPEKSCEQDKQGNNLVVPMASLTNQEGLSRNCAGSNERSKESMNDPEKSCEQDQQGSKEIKTRKKNTERKRKHDRDVKNSEDGSAKRKKNSEEQTALNILLVCSEWTSSKGGIPTFNRELAVNLAKFCSDLNVFCHVTEGSQKEQDDAKTKNVKLIVTEPDLESMDPFAPLHDLPKELEVHKPNIVISHGRKFGGAAQDLRDKVPGCKWVHFVHVDCEQMGKFKEGETAIDENEEKDKVELKFCKQADLVVAVGPKLHEKYQRSLTNYKVKVQVIVPGLCEEFLEVRRPDGEETKDSQFHVYVFGRGSNEDFRLKGYDIAAKALAGLPSNFCLFAVGAPKKQQKDVTKRFRTETGIEEKKLTVRSYCNDRVEMKDLFSRANMIVMPSREEAFGMIGLEAISAGIPVLVSSRSGLAEVLKHLSLVGANCVVDSEDPKLWSEKIRSSWSNPKEQRNEQAAEVRDKYEAKHMWCTECYKLEEIFKNLCD